MAALEKRFADQTFTVLVPTDFSEVSRGAVAFALSTFQGRLTHLILLHAYRDHAPSTAPMISVVDILREKSERMMLQELKHIRTLPHHEHLSIVTSSRFDGLYESILDICNVENIDLVVIGSNGHLHPRPESRHDEIAIMLQKLNRPLLLVPKLLN